MQVCWMSVAYRPEEEGSYLVWDDGTVQAKYLKDRNVFITLDEKWVLKPTHWMEPLKSPEEE